MSMGWMTHVASIPDAPPLKNGLMFCHTDLAAGFASASFASALSTTLSTLSILSCGAAVQSTRCLGWMVSAHLHALALFVSTTLPYSSQAWLSSRTYLMFIYLERPNNWGVYLDDNCNFKRSKW